MTPAAVTLSVPRDRERLRFRIRVALVVVVRDSLSGSDNSVLLRRLLHVVPEEELSDIEADGLRSSLGVGPADISEIATVPVESEQESSLSS